MNLVGNSMVHSFEFNNNYFVLDCNSGALHSVDIPAYKVINKINEYKRYDQGKFYDKIELDKAKIFNDLKGKLSEGTVNNVLLEIEKLIEKGQLFSENMIDEELNLKEDQVKALCLNISHSCNMNCMYCFAEGGTFGENMDKKKAAFMDIKTAKFAVDFLMEKSKGLKNCEVDFFGGEPLLNWNVLKQTVDYALKQASLYDKNIKFTLTTNGLSLNKEVINFLNEYDFAVVLSLDGRKEVHDSNRKDLKNIGTYDRIVPLYKEFVKSRNHKEYFVRGTFTAENIDFSNDVEHILGLGFKDISLEPVVCSNNHNYSLENVDFKRIEEEYQKLALFYEEKANKGEGFSFYHFEVDLDGGPCLKKRFSGCGAGNEYLAVTPSGQIYPCHQFVGQSDFLMGNVNESFYIDKAVSETFSKNNFLGKEACRDCWAKFYCGGGCHANAYLMNASLNKPYLIGCKMERARLECALYLASRGVLQRHK